MLNNFKSKLDRNELKIKNDNANNVIKGYNFIGKDDFNSNNIQLIQSKIKESGIMMINYFIEEGNQKEGYFILGFKKTILIIQMNSIDRNILHAILSSHPRLSICFYNDELKQVFDRYIKIRYEIIKMEEKFKSEIQQLNKIFSIEFLDPKNESNLTIFEKIKPCITGFLICEGYEKSDRNRLNDIRFYSFNQKRRAKYIKKNQYQEIKSIGHGSSFQVYLAYHIEEGEFHAIKKPHETLKKEEINKLVSREVENYCKFNYILFPKFYGKIRDKNDWISIEFIKGETLSNIKIDKLSKKDKFHIVLDIMLSINFLNRNQYVYRDLKPSNIIIDQRKNAILLDFDRTINCREGKTIFLLLLRLLKLI